MLAAVVLSQLTGDPVWDGIGTLVIGMLLAVIAITLAVEMKSLLIGEGALPEQRERLLAAVAASPDVERLVHMRTEYLGPDEMLVAAKVHFGGDADHGRARRRDRPDRGRHPGGGADRPGHLSRARSFDPDRVDSPTDADDDADDDSDSDSDGDG